MIRHYAEPEGRVIFDHRHNADERALHMRAFMHSHAYFLTVRSTLSAIARSLFHRSG
jgi:hypothetical protein